MTTLFKADDVQDFTGRVALVTGGARSIGLETTYLLLRKNCTVFVAGRSQSGYDSAKKDLSSRSDISAQQIERLSFHKLDLSEMVHSEQSGKDFVAQHGDRLDIVIANAGVSLQRADELSKDGYELTFQTNQLGHFAFIKALLPLLEKTAGINAKGPTDGAVIPPGKGHDVRVVITSSDAHAFAKNGIDFDRLTKTEKHKGFWGLGDGMVRYGVSKLANMLFARELDKRWAKPLREQGKRVMVDSAHPGMILNTGLGGTGEDWGIPSFVNTLVRASSYFAGFSSLEGAMTGVFVATNQSPVGEPSTEHGKFYVPKTNWRGRYIGSAAQKPDTQWGEDEELAAKLWDFCEAALKKAESAPVTQA